MRDDIRVSYDDYGLNESGEPMLVILDTGIAIEETADNLQKLRLLFRAVVDRRVSLSNINVNMFYAIKNISEALTSLSPFYYRYVAC